MEEKNRDYEIPGAGAHLWEWFEQLNAGVGRIRDGVCFPIPWTEFQAWASVTGNVVFPSEYAILRAIDLAFCDEINKELEAYRLRLSEKAKAQNG